MGTMTNETIIDKERWVQETWKAYSPQIYNLCRSKCTNRDDAKDLFQNVALRFCQNAQKIMYQDSVYPWLIRVLRNCFYDAKRLRCKEPPFSCVSDVLGDYMALPQERSLFFQSGNVQNDELNRIVRSLSQADREVIDMAFHKGLTNEEMSAMYGVSLNAMSKRRHSAIKRARRVLIG